MSRNSALIKYAVKTNGSFFLQPLFLLAAIASSSGNVLKRFSSWFYDPAVIHQFVPTPFFFLMRLTLLSISSSEKRFLRKNSRTKNLAQPSQTQPSTIAAILSVYFQLKLSCLPTEYSLQDASSTLSNKA